MDRAWIGRLAIRLAIVAAIVAGLWIVREQFFKDDPRERRIAQRVRLVDAPKPPPPKVEEKPLEVRQDKEVEVARETPKDAAPGPPSDRLGVVGEGTGGADAFGLEARRGGRDITAIGSDKGAGGAGWTWYGGVLKKHLEEHTRQDKRLHGHAFQVVLRLWIGPDGTVAKFDVASTGDPQVDTALKEILAALPRLREPPPEDMPQPVRLRVTSRLAG